MNEFALKRNSYLHTRSDAVNARILNRSVDLARDEPLIDGGFYWEPPVFRLATHQPNIPTEDADLTVRPVAFGSWALPKLRREIHHKDPTVVINALLSLSDLLRDPERGYEAIKLNIPDRLADKLQDPLPPIREGAALVMSVLAEMAHGRDAILRNDELVEQLFYGVGDEQISVRLKIAACLEMLARCWMAADILVDAGLIETLLEILDKEEMMEIVELHLKTLRSLMYSCGKCIALKENGFRILTKYLEHRSPSVVCKTLDCLAILMSTRKGKKLAIQKNFLHDVVHWLQYGDNETCKKAANVLMFCTVKTKAKHLAIQFKTLPRRLIKLAANPVNVTLQMFCLKALTNICEHPVTRKHVRERYMGDLLKLQVDPINTEIRNVLMKVIGWVPQDHL